MPSPIQWHSTRISHSHAKSGAIMKGFPVLTTNLSPSQKQVSGEWSKPPVSHPHHHLPCLPDLCLMHAKTNCSKDVLSAFTKSAQPATPLPSQTS
eukprot:1124760-Pelagomonas_calceolata.AAC.1